MSAIKYVQVASSTNEQLSNTFYFPHVSSGKFYNEQLAFTFHFLKSVIPSVSGPEMSPIISISNGMFSIE
jgi:hypothetical protein